MAKAPGLVAQSKSARDLFVEWANAQDHWVRALAAEVVNSRRQLSDAAIEQVYGVLLREKELEPGERPLSLALVTGATVGDPEDQLLLATLSAVQNVNALAEGQVITFNPRLTVLYGENAAGKTGYVRILKAASGARDSEPVLGNVSNESAGTPVSRISYRLGSAAPVELEWRGQNGISPLNRIDVFDTRGLLQHVDGEISYVYTPGDLALFRIASQGIEGVKAKLELDRKAREPQRNPFLLKFGRDSDLYSRIEALGPSTELSELEALAVVSTDEEAELRDRQETVRALEGRGATETLARSRDDRDLHSQVLGLCDVITGLDRSAYQDAIREMEDARAEHQRIGRDSLASEKIPGVLGTKWSEFVVAAEKYISAELPPDYPVVDAPCAFCRQHLSQTATTLVEKYTAFLNDRSHVRAEDQEKVARKSVSALVEAEVDHVLAGIQRRLAAFEPGQTPQLLTECHVLLEGLKVLQARLGILDPAAFDATALDMARTLRPRLKVHIDHQDEAIKSLTVAHSGRQARLVEESRKARALADRLILREVIDPIRAFVLAAKWADRATRVGKRFQALLKSLTEASKLASEEVLNHNFEILFQRECEALKVPRLQLDFPGRKGEPARRKSITPKHKLSETLSEGEQKVVALADCLAEAALRRSASPIVLDDPVNSLDYKRLAYVVRRLVDLSKSRQVVVFTHNIWFTMELLCLFDDDRKSCSYFEISSEGDVHGLVAPGSSPRLDSWNDKKKRLNHLVERAKKAADTLDKEVFVEKGYDDLRGACELIVEQDLLKKVVQSYAPNVMVGKLKEIKWDLLPEASATVNEIFEKCCRFTGAHRQPLETLSVRPTLEGLEQDWKLIQEVHSKFTN